MLNHRLRRYYCARTDKNRQTVDRSFNNALRAADIDTIYLTGYGFPGYRGGPMWYADTIGLRKVLDRIMAFQRTHADFWEPAPLLRQLAESGRTFADWDAEQEKRFATS